MNRNEKHVHFTPQARTENKGLIHFKNRIKKRKFFEAKFSHDQQKYEEERHTHN